MPDPYLISHILLWGVVVVLAIAVFALYQHFGEMYLNSPAGREGQGPALDEPLPRAHARDLEGEPVELPAATETLLTFMEVDCKLCRELRGALVEFAERRASTTAIAVVGGAAREVAEFATRLDGSVRVVADARGRLTTRYGVGAFPFAVVVDRSGIVRRKAIVNTRAGLEALVPETSDNSAVAREGVTVR